MKISENTRLVGRVEASPGIGGVARALPIFQKCAVSISARIVQQFSKAWDRRPALPFAVSSLSPCGTWAAQAHFRERETALAYMRRYVERSNTAQAPQAFQMIEISRFGKTIIGASEKRI